MALNPLTGSIISKDNAKPSANKSYTFLDMNGDKRSTTADQLPFTSINGGTAYASGLKVSNGIPTELTFVANASNLTSLPSLVGTDPYSGSGGFVAMLEANAQGVGTGLVGGGPQGAVTQRPDGSGGGKFCFGTVGTANIDCGEAPPVPTGGVRVVSSTWRELKN
jgi:hypothetical protein